MEFTVHRNGETAGTVTVSETARAVQFAVNCTLKTAEVLRCYGLRPPDPPLLIGIPEPVQGTLRLQRSLSRQSIAGAIPESYVLLDAAQDIRSSPTLPEQPQKPAILTGDALLDALLQDRAVRAQQEGALLRLYCPFDAALAFPLAFAAPACTVEQLAGEWVACLKITLPPSGAQTS